ncbi:RNA polymerase sigma factor [Novosphingobium terrae]|uniref:RNA polymerase sigma factor n=1 Tax=Novosphingobium terrae TaxID=2726189 RepID=UPI00197FABB5|nr:sigma-70 family RNA polymerase sigma factor [Novosphingobium terrae]
MNTIAPPSPAPSTAASRLIADLAQTLGRLRAYVRAHVGDAADAEDIVQESLERTLRRAHETDIARPDFFAISVARNLMVDRHRRQPAFNCELEDTLPCSAPLPDQQLSDRERLARFHAALEAMTPLRRDIFIRRRIDGQSREDIARALNMQSEAVKKHITRAMAQLTLALDDDIAVNTTA